MNIQPRETNRIGRCARWLVSVCLLVLAGCGSDKPTAVTRPLPVCNKALGVEVVSNEIESTFYPSSKWEQAKDLLDPVGSYHKYGMTFNTSVRLRNLDDADLRVERSVGALMIKNEGMAQRSYESALSEFVVRAKSDTVVHFRFKVDIASLTADYFKLIVSSEKVGYFFKSSHKYSYADAKICPDSALAAVRSGASDSAIKDYVSVPEIADATYKGATTASEATASSAKWTIDNWDQIKCALFVLVLLVGIVLGGHAGSGGC